MNMNGIYNGKELLEKVLTEIRALQSIFYKEQYCSLIKKRLVYFKLISTMNCNLNYIGDVIHK